MAKSSEPDLGIYSGSGNRGTIVLQKLISQKVDLGSVGNVFNALGSASKSNIARSKFSSLSGTFSRSRSKYSYDYQMYGSKESVVKSKGVSEKNNLLLGNSFKSNVGNIGVSKSINSSGYMVNTRNVVDYKLGASLKNNLLIDSGVKSESVLRLDSGVKSVQSTKLDQGLLSDSAMRYSQKSVFKEVPVKIPFMLDFPKEKKSFGLVKKKKKVVKKAKLKSGGVYVLPDLMSVSRTEAYNYRVFGKGEAVAPRLTKSIYNKAFSAFKGYGVGFIPTEQMRTGRVRL
jgi:hypothetical protein